MSILVTDTNLLCCIVKVSVYIYGTNINTERDVSTVSYLHRKADFTTFIRYYWHGFVVGEPENFFFPFTAIQIRTLTYVPCAKLPWRSDRVSWPWDLQVL